MTVVTNTRRHEKMEREDAIAPSMTSTFIRTALSRRRAKPLVLSSREPVNVASVPRVR